MPVGPSTGFGSLGDIAREEGFSRVDARLASPALQTALDRLEVSDGDLLKHHASEQAVCHRIAVYLEQELAAKSPDEWNVDCEYNLYLYEDSKRMLLPTTAVRSSRGTIPTVIPDIIVHKRGRVHNLLAIEAKWVRPLISPRSAQQIRHDLQKLKVFGKPAEADGADQQYAYQRAVFVALAWSPRSAEERTACFLRTS